MKTLSKILVFTIFSSCTAYNLDTVSGLYRTKGGFEWGSSISFTKDSNFVYDWQIGLLFGHETGKWNLDGNKLILNSDYHRQIDTIPNYYLLNKNINNLSKIRFQLYFPDSTEALIGATGIMINQNDTIYETVSDFNGIMDFPECNFDSIKISFVGLKNIVISDSVNNYFEIASVNYPIDYMYEYFENEIWNIKGRKLIDRSKNKYYYEKRFYKIK